MPDNSVLSSALGEAGGTHLQAICTSRMDLSGGSAKLEVSVNCDRKIDDDVKKAR